MNLREHDTEDGMKVWLSEHEVDQLLDAASDTDQYLAFALGARCGLRSHEILQVAPEHVVETDAGAMLRVWSGKGDKFRETPIPSNLAARISTIDDVRDGDRDEPLLTVETRTLRNWISRVGDELAAREEDEGWSFLSMHDLRRTWATNLGAQEVDPLIVLDWGGWSDLETFLDHYRGTYSPEAQAREREKIEWL
jgi:integrase